jgi:hypothetical protein
VLGRGGCPSVWTDRNQGSSCFNAGTSVARDNRLATSVQTHFFDSGSAAAVGRQERWTQRLFVWLAKGGRKVENFESNGCARRARKLCGAAHWGGDLRAGEKVRERAGVAGEARARQIWQKETALWARWGAHRERVGQTRRQRLGVARRSANTHGIARCIPVFWVWGGR